MTSSPKNPGSFAALQVRDDQIHVALPGAEPARLGADVLDVEMPVLARCDPAADGLLDGDARGHCVEHQAHGLRGVEISGAVDGRHTPQDDTVCPPTLP